MKLMKPPATGQRDASAILNKAMVANDRGFVRVYSDSDAATLSRAGWTIAAVFADPDDDPLALRKAASGAAPTRASNGETLQDRLPLTIARRSDAALKSGDVRKMQASYDELTKLGADARALAAIKAAHLQPKRITQ